MNTVAPSLADFQQAFTAHLWRPEDTQALQAPGWMSALAAQPGFSVYRNTVLKACIDALQANYPAITRLVGEEWFRAAALEYVRAAPPHDARLLHYGAGFALFLRGFPPAAQLPYLASVAQLEQLWTESHGAADAPPCTTQALVQLPPERLGRLVLRPHPATRWLWCPDAPAYTLWQRNRSAHDGSHAELEWQAEGALLTRPAGAVQAQAFSQAGCAFLDACAAYAPLAQAAEAALQISPETDIGALLAQLLGAGAFTLSAFSAP